MSAKILLRYSIIAALTASVHTVHAQDLEINKGPFKPTDESLKEYRYPE